MHVSKLLIGKYKNNLNLEKIFLTHHHADHIDGLDNILEKHNAVTIGAQADNHRLPKLDEYVQPGDQFLFQGQVYIGIFSRNLEHLIISLWFAFIIQVLNGFHIEDIKQNYIHHKTFCHHA